MARYGLIGKNIAYSFSRDFFTTKFEQEHRKATYENFDLDRIELFPELIKTTEHLKGLNVTIPYKEAIIPFLDELDPEAEIIGAVNTIKIKKNGKLVGYNTDHYGFAKALEVFFPMESRTALILGNGGAAKAISYVLETMNFDYKIVSRTPSEQGYTYKQLNETIMENHALIINCTPLGTYPNTEEYPHIPYQFINSDHKLFDLIYNPSKTEFLKLGFASGAKITNGQKMLEYQALKAWAIWKS